MRSVAPRPLPFAHPLWIVYSSGTTGLPKAVVHGRGGVMLEALKFGTIHNDCGPSWSGSLNDKAGTSVTASRAAHSIITATRVAIRVLDVSR